jgi:hypothetical protein
VAETVSLTGERPSAVNSVPRDGLIDRVAGLPDRLPWPDLVWFTILLAAILVVGHLPGWLAGEVPVGELALYVLLPAAITVYFLALIRIMRRVAQSAFEEFRPALGATSDAEDRLGRELVRIPDRAAVVAIAVTLLGVATFSAGATSTDIPPVGNVSTWILWWVAMATLGLAVFYTLRQLRWVSRLHEMADRIDLFDTAPINALARLTATSALGILVVALVFLFGSDESLGAEGGDRTFALVAGLALVALSIASFASPLRGMHRRLVVEKRRLLHASSERMKETLALIHATVDNKDFAHADELQKTLTSLLAERDVLARLPTWPWSPGTLRGFATAAVLPVLLWLVIRLLERFVG